MPSVSEGRFSDKLRHWLRLDLLPAGIRRWVIGVIGGTILLIGLALVFLPGPAFVVIPVGLAVLATEFAWARRYLHNAGSFWQKIKKRFGKKPDAER